MLPEPRPGVARIAALLVVWAAIAWAAALAAFVAAAGAITELGWTYSLAGGTARVSGVAADGPAAGALAAGDRILALDGAPASRPRTFLYLRRLALASERYEIEVERAGERRRASLAPRPAPLGELVFRSTVVATTGLALLALGAFVTRARPHDRPAARFAAGAATGSLFFLGWLLNPVAPHLGPAGRFLPLLVALSHPLQFAFAHHFYSTFPPSVRPGRLARGLTVALYALGALLALAGLLLGAIALARREVALPLLLAFEPWIAARHRLFNGYLLAACLGIAGSCLANLRRVAAPDERRRLRWVIAGAALAFGSWILADSLPALFYVPGWLDVALDYLGVLATLFVPATVAYAVVVHRVFGIEVVLRQSVRYLLARSTLRLALALPLAALVVRALARPELPVAELLFGHPGVALAAGLAALALLARPRLLAAIDRRFFRERQRQEQLLLALAADLDPALDLGEIARRVATQVDRALHPTTLALYLRSGERPALDFGYTTGGAATGDALLAEGSALAAALEASPRARALPLATPLPEAEARALEATGARLALPLLSPRLGLVGALLLGEKRSEEPYTAEDRRRLEAVAAQIALAQENRLLSDRVARGRAARDEVLARLDREGRRPLFECPACGRCFDTGGECPDDRAELEPTLPVERTLAGRYRLDRLLGRGGMGAVYLARDLSLERDVAVKVMTGRLFGDPLALARFRREARAAARLDHPAIVRVHDYGECEGAGAFLVMELVAGRSLRAALGAGPGVDRALAAAWLGDLCAGLAAAHAAGLVHRDLKPENLLLAADVALGRERLKIADFGLAKAFDEGDASLTETGRPLGTPAYMAPEQLDGRADPRTDLHAVGVVALELATGENPFRLAALPATTDAVARKLPRLDPAAPAVTRFEAALERCLAKDPAARFGSAEEAAAALVPALAALPGGVAVAELVLAGPDRTPTLDLGDPGAASPGEVSIRPRPDRPESGP